MTLVSRYGNREEFLYRFNPSSQNLLCTDTDDCFFGDYPTLEQVRVSYGNNAPTIWVIPQLYNLSEYCGVRDKLTDEQIENTANVIASNYLYLKVSELLLFFHRFKAGYYGRFYGKVDPIIITTSLREFIRARGVTINLYEQHQRQLQYERSKQNAITWEEYCIRTHQEGKKSPFE